MNYTAVVMLACYLLVATMFHHSAAQETPAKLVLAEATVSPALLTDVTDDGKLVIQSTTEHRNLEPANIVRWNSGRAIQPTSAVWLRDGSWLSGSIQWLGPSSLRLNSEWFESIELNLDDLRGILLHPSPAYRQSLELHTKMAALNGSADAFWNKDSEQLQGVLSIEWRASTLAAPGRPVWFLRPTNSSERVELRDNELMSVVFSPVLRKPLVPKPEWPLITMRDGSRLRVSKLRRLANQRLQIVLSDDFQVETLDMIDQYLPSIAAIEASPTNVTWLSDLEPARYRLLDSASKLTWPLGRDADLYGKRLWLDGLPVSHGLVVHSPAQVAFRTDGRAKRFLSEVQLLGNHGSSSRPLGSARCQVLLARQGELNSVYRSEVLRPDDVPQLIDVDIQGAQLVVLLVEEADLGPMGDHVLWREARMVDGGGK